jgi:hypothetical protein
MSESLKNLFPEVETGGQFNPSSEPIVVTMEDNQNYVSLFEQIKVEGIRDVRRIIQIIGSFHFSSERTKQHSIKSILWLFERGALTPEKLQEHEAITIEAINTDAKGLYNK